MEVVNGNVKVMSEMLTELVPQKATPSDLELLQVGRRNIGHLKGVVLSEEAKCDHSRNYKEVWSLAHRVLSRRPHPLTSIFPNRDCNYPFNPFHPKMYY